MFKGTVLAVVAALAVPAVAADTYTKREHCAAIKRQELDLLETGHYDTARERRSLFDWAVRECGSLDLYQATRPAPKRRQPAA